MNVFAINNNKRTIALIVITSGSFTPWSLQLFFNLRPAPKEQKLQYKFLISNHLERQDYQERVLFHGLHPTFFSLQ